MLRRFISTLTRRRYVFGGGVATLATLGVLLVSHQAHATNAVVSTVNSVGNDVFLLLDNVVMAMIKLFGAMTEMFVSILVIVAQYNTFLKAPIVEQGWPIVRDLMNMMFILVLLIISAGTVLRLQNYQYNRLLGKLIIMAFLVNFSKFIAVFLLQFAQVVMLTFVNAFKEVAMGNFSHMFGLDAVLQYNSTAGTDPGGIKIFVTLVAGMAMMMVAFVVILAITVVLFVRIIALWLLIILSPIAYALRILPNTEGQASKWWAEFTKYVVVGPVMCFFLWLALALVGGKSCPSNDTTCGTNPLSQADKSVNSVTATAILNNKPIQANNFATELLSMNRLITFVVGIIFLMMGLQYAQNSGTAGAAFAGKVASAGFSTASAITGLSSIRDRTIAPVQGYFKERARRRESAVQERVAGLGAAVDRTTNATIGQVGRGRAAITGAAGAASRSLLRGEGVQEAMRQGATGAALGGAQGTRGYRQSQARVAQYDAGVIAREAKEKDMANATPDQLADMRRTGGGRTRMGAELASLNRGTMQLDTSSPQDIESLQRLMAAAQSVQNNPELRKQYQEAIEKAMKRPSTSAGALQQILSQRGLVADPITRLDAGEELANRRLLNADDARTVNGLAEGLSADKATSFRKTLYAKQGDVAIDAFHSHLQDPNDPNSLVFDDADGLLAAMERGEADQKILKERHLIENDPYRLNAMTAAQRAQIDQTRERMGQGLIDMHQAKGTPEKIGDGFSARVKNELFNDISLDDGTDQDERAKIANATGAAHRVFRNAANTFMADEFRNYIAQNAAKFAETVNANAFAGDMTNRGRADSNEMVDAMASAPGLYASHFRTMSGRGPTMYSAMAPAFERGHTRAVAANPTGVEYDRAAGDSYDAQQRLRVGNAISTRSASLLWDPSQAHGQDSLNDFVASAEGGELGRIHLSAPYRNIIPAGLPGAGTATAAPTQEAVQVSIVQNLREAEVPNFAAANVNTAREAYHHVYTMLPNPLSPELRHNLADNSHTARLV